MTDIDKQTEGNYILENDRLYDTATYERNRSTLQCPVYRDSNNSGLQIKWNKSKKSKDVIETVDGDSYTVTQSENGFHFYGANFCCWRAYPDPHRVIQEIIDDTISNYGQHFENHLEELKEGKGDNRFGCFTIQLYMVPGANNSKYALEGDTPIVEGAIFIGSFHVSGIPPRKD